MAGIAVPPGRVGRLWLRRRLETAARGVDLLERELTALRRLHDGAAETAWRTGAKWRRLTTAARDAQVRAQLAVGPRGIRIALPDPLARATRPSATPPSRGSPPSSTASPPLAPEPESRPAHAAPPPLQARPRDGGPNEREEAAHVKAECALHEHPALGRWLRQNPSGRLPLDRTKIAAETELDGKYLLSTSDPDLSAEDVALGYKNLLEAERGFRDLKSTIELRPVFHRLEPRIAPTCCCAGWRCY